MNAEKPLVTISMLTYNQERYVRDAIRGALSQTYEPLEIVISDDCSTDRTWEIVNEEVDNYKKAGGTHKNIVLNRNKRNLGIACHFNVVSKMSHGILSVGNSGDDVSLPNRVEEIVNAWKSGACRPTLIMHYANIIDMDEHVVGVRNDMSPWNPLGAVNTYDSQIYVKFPPMRLKEAFEDWVYSLRALIIGRSVCIPKMLVNYRVGSGISTKVGDFQKVLSLNYHMQTTYRQMLIDIEYAKTHGYHAPIKEYEDRVSQLLNCLERQIALQSGKNLSDRFRAFIALQRIAKTRSIKVLVDWLAYVIMGRRAWKLIQIINGRLP